MFPTVDENLLQNAQKGDRRAIEQVLEQLKPAMVRIALGLTGRQDVALGVLRFVFLKGATQYASWNDPASPARWFYHHAILTARRAEIHTPDPASDPLARNRQKELPYLAMLRAIRQLPRQQTEAVLLKYGEELELRPLAVAMDCSTTAATTHLDGAMKTLNSMSGDQSQKLLETLREQFQALSLPPEDVLDLSRRSVRQALAPKRFKTILILVLLLIAIVTVLWLYSSVFK